MAPSHAEWSRGSEEVGASDSELPESPDCDDWEGVEAPTRFDDEPPQAARSPTLNKMAAADLVTRKAYDRGGSATGPLALYVPFSPLDAVPQRRRVDVEQVN